MSRVTQPRGNRRRRYIVSKSLRPRSSARDSSSEAPSAVACLAPTHAHYIYAIYVLAGRRIGRAPNIVLHTYTHSGIVLSKIYDTRNVCEYEQSEEPCKSRSGSVPGLVCAVVRHVPINKMTNSAAVIPTVFYSWVSPVSLLAAVCPTKCPLGFPPKSLHIYFEHFRSSLS